MNHNDTFPKIELLKKAIIEEYEYLGCTNIHFMPANDGANLICTILTTDLNGEVIEGHIYKSFDKKLRPCFIARFYE